MSSNDLEKQLPKLEDDLSYRIQNLITNYVSMSGDPLHSLAMDVINLINDEKVKELEYINQDSGEITLLKIRRRIRELSKREDKAK